MPAIVLAASGFVAGVLAGLSFAPSAWLVWPGTAVAAAAIWARSRGASLICLGVAAGGLWGAAAAGRAAASCTAAWREGERLAVVVEPWDLAVPGRRTLVRMRGPAVEEAGSREQGAGSSTEEDASLLPAAP